MNNFGTKIKSGFKPKKRRTIIFYNIKGEKRIIEEAKLNQVAKTTQLKGINYQRYRRIIYQLQKDIKHNEKERRKTKGTE